MCHQIAYIQHTLDGWTFHLQEYIYTEFPCVALPGCPGTRCVDWTGLRLRDSPASASRVLGLLSGMHHYHLTVEFIPAEEPDVCSCFSDSVHLLSPLLPVG